VNVKNAKRPRISSPKEGVKDAQTLNMLEKRMKTLKQEQSKRLEIINHTKSPK